MPLQARVPSETSNNFPFGVRRMLVPPPSDGVYLRLGVPDRRQFVIGRKIAPVKDGIGIVPLRAEYRRRGEGPLIDLSLYGHLEPVGLNALEMMRTVMDYNHTKDMKGSTWDAEKYWAELIEQKEETPNARWSENYYMDGVIYEREPSDSAGGYVGSITMGSGGGGLDLAEAKRDLTDKWRSFIHYYGQTPVWDYWDRSVLPPPPRAYALLSARALCRARRWRGCGSASR